MSEIINDLRNAVGYIDGYRGNKPASHSPDYLKGYSEGYAKAESEAALSEQKEPAQ